MPGTGVQSHVLHSASHKFTVQQERRVMGEMVQEHELLRKLRTEAPA